MKEIMSLKSTSFLAISVLCMGLLLTGCQASTAKPSSLAKTESVTTESTSAENVSKAVFSSNDLSDAVLSNDLEKVQLILSQGKVNVNEKDADGHYPLEQVFVFNNLEMAQVLLENGADPKLELAGNLTIYDKVMNESTEEMRKLFKQYNI